jgi:hypothetical protein
VNREGDASAKAITHRAVVSGRREACFAQDLRGQVAGTRQATQEKVRIRWGVPDTERGNGVVADASLRKIRPCIRCFATRAKHGDVELGGLLVRADESEASLRRSPLRG